MEEAEIPVSLQGIYRIEHTPGIKGTRFRIVFAAVPEDNRPPKSVANDEIIEAKWLTIEEIKKHSTKEAAF